MGVERGRLARFDAYRWHTQRVEDGNDTEAIEAAIEAAQADDRPSLIAVRTHIGFGSPNRQDSQKAHGQPARRGRGPPDEGGLRLGSGPPFYVPDEALALFRRAVARGGDARRGVGGPALDAYARRVSGGCRRAPAAPRRAARARAGTRTSRPTRRAARSSRRARRARRRSQASRRSVPELFGGAADLSESNLTDVKGGRRLQRRTSPAATSASVSASTRWAARRTGSRYHGGFIPYVGTFLTFSDYMRGLGPAGGVVRPPRDLRLDPRLDRPRRGRPDPPAGRALRGAARDPEPVVRPAGRSERGHGRVGGRGGARNRRLGRRPGGTGRRWR